MQRLSPRFAGCLAMLSDFTGAEKVYVACGYITYTYSCNRCKEETGEATIVKAAHEPSVMPGSFASAEAIAYIMTQKYVMHSPLYRLQQEMESMESN